MSLICVHCGGAGWRNKSYCTFIREPRWDGGQHRRTKQTSHIARVIEAQRHRARTELHPASPGSSIPRSVLSCEVFLPQGNPRKKGAIKRVAGDQFVAPVVHGDKSILPIGISEQCGHEAGSVSHKWLGEIE